MIKSFHFPPMIFSVTSISQETSIFSFSVFSCIVSLFFSAIFLLLILYSHFIVNTLSLRSYHCTTFKSVRKAKKTIRSILPRQIVFLLIHIVCRLLCNFRNLNAYIRLFFHWDFLIKVIKYKRGHNSYNQPEQIDRKLTCRGNKASKRNDHNCCRDDNTDNRMERKIVVMIK